MNFEIREELKRFLVQINGKTISFQIRDRRYVLSGRSQLRHFTEYWDIALGANNKGYIVAICEIQNGKY